MSKISSWDWQKILAHVFAIVGAALAALAAHNGTEIANRAAMASPGDAVQSVWSAWTSVPGLSSAASLAFSMFLHSFNKKSPTLSNDKSSRTNALRVLAVECAETDDAEGFKLVSGLLAYFKQRDAGLVKLAETVTTPVV